VFAQRLALALALLVVLAGLQLGCGTRTIRQEVVRTDSVEAELRSIKRGRELVVRDYAHPAAIAPVRLTHILSHIDVELGDGEKRRRVPAIPAELIYEFGDALSLGLEGATPNQDVLVRGFRLERRFGVFTTRYMTSLSAHLQGDRLVIQIGHVDWEVPKYGAESGSGTQSLPEPIEGRELMDFRVVPDDALEIGGRQVVLVDWRGERFSDPDRLKIGPGGQVKRRTVLMEEPAPAAPGPSGPALEKLAPDTLRKLADLEEERRRGDLTEAQYQARRREILDADPGSK
jgi:hypothetical protein